MGILTPTKGTRTVHRNLKFGYFSQHHVDQLDMNVCAVELLQQAYPGLYATEGTWIISSLITGTLFNTKGNREALPYLPITLKNMAIQSQG